MSKLTIEEKAKKYDQIEAIIAKHWEEGSGSDLYDIGLDVGEFFGWL